MIKKADLSVIIPTYNEYGTILHLVEVIKDKLPESLLTEIIIVDDNSPDGTGRLIANYIEDMIPGVRAGIQQMQENSNNMRINPTGAVVKLVYRENKHGLISAILQGIRSSTGRHILVMDGDFSHPPETIPVLINELLSDPNCIVVASRYTRGGSIRGWPYRRLLLSRLATKIAIHGLKLCNVKDPISGFFAFPRQIMENIRIDTYGYKLLLEILVKARGVKVKEIPYTFVGRKSGKSKLDTRVMLDYLSAVWYLYRYGRKSKRATRYKEEQKRRSVLFLSKAARFYSVGATGLLLNYIVSMMLTKGIISNFWYIQASTIGIILSITSNFFLNKIWTFEDRNFSRNTIKQYTMFLGLSTVGAVIQLILLYLLIQSGFQYAASLVLAVAVASVSNFLLNKRWTFREKIWG